MVCLIIDGSIILFELIVFYLCTFIHTFRMFQYYTYIFNLMLLISTTIYFVYGIKNYIKYNQIPRWAFIFQYCSTVCIAITFFGLFVVIPTMGIDNIPSLFFKNNLIFQHTLCPILAVAAFLLFDEKQFISIKDTILSLIPIGIYALVFLTLNIFKVIEGPYDFFLIYEQPWYLSLMWIILIPGTAFLFSLLFRYINNKMITKGKEITA